MSKNELLKKYEDKRQKCLVFSRVMGYLRPTCSYNDSKQSEWNERVLFAERACACHCK